MTINLIKFLRIISIEGEIHLNIETQRSIAQENQNPKSSYHKNVSWRTNKPYREVALNMIVAEI